MGLRNIWKTGIVNKIFKVAIQKQEIKKIMIIDSSFFTIPLLKPIPKYNMRFSGEEEKQKQSYIPNINSKQYVNKEQYKIDYITSVYKSSSSPMSIRKTNILIYPTEKVIFPYSEYSFSISSNIYEPEVYDNLIGFATKIDQNDHRSKEVEKIQGISRFGSLLKISKSEVSGYRTSQTGKIIRFNLFGLAFARFRIVSMKSLEGYYIATVDIFQDEITKEVELTIERKKLLQNLKKQLKLYYDLKLKHHDAEQKNQQLQNQKSINKVIYRTCTELQLTVYDKLKLLQTPRQDIKMQNLLTLLSQKTQRNKSVIDLQEKVRQQMIKSQTQRRPVSARPGFSSSGGGRNGQFEQIQERLKNKKLPEHVREEIQKQLKRTGGDSQSAVTLKYIETLLDIPWMESSEQVKDLSTAQKILNEDHTGLAQVKERILQFLAVRFRNGNTKGNIICLHGPPGVGKTSIAKSIAKALGKQFTRVSLGGMNDQAELRGHRRTYVAAMPGVIVRALIKAKSNNPVILLDQIQKMGTSYKGNPEHALLQILDPSQNSSFKDHYVSLPVDLSKVMFICTANSLELSGPLLNRLQLIEVPGYSRKQKLDILSNHLLPNQLKQNGVQNLISFQNAALQELVKYNNQMGVRQLERNLAKVCRKMARKNQKQIVTVDTVQEILGPINKMDRWNGIGIVNGMAWTQMGGKLLMVQAIKYPTLNSKPKVQVTGQLGDVMKQSINIALSWIKANRNDFSLWSGGDYSMSENIDELDKLSLHLHFPAGGIKKDGPSAGVTIVTCLVSLLIKVPAREMLSMTGEITLSGQVLPVGGVREKCIAAIYEGMKHIVIPHGNIKDMQKIPEQLRKSVNFYPVRTIQQVLGVAFPTLLDKQPPKI